MNKFRLFLILILFTQFISGQDKYLSMTRERQRGIKPTSLEEIPIAIAIDIIASKLPPPAPVERKIREGALVKVISYGEKGKEKIKGKLNILNDSTINVGTVTILIDNIKKIYVNTTFSRIYGPVIAGAGIAGTVFLTPVFLECLSFFGEDGILVLAGLFSVPFVTAALISCAIGAVGGIIYFFNGRVFNTAESRHNNHFRWDIRVASLYSPDPEGP